MFSSIVDETCIEAQRSFKNESNRNIVKVKPRAEFRIPITVTAFVTEHRAST